MEGDLCSSSLSFFRRRKHSDTLRGLCECLPGLWLAASMAAQGGSEANQQTRERRNALWEGLDFPPFRSSSPYGYAAAFFSHIRASERKRQKE